MVDLKLGFTILISLLNSIYLAESSCSRGCDLALGSYYVWVGTNLSFIAEVTNGDINNIIRYNPQIPSPDILLVGSRINVPFPCDCINGEFLGHMFNYRVRPGDTYDLVANRNYANLTTAAWTERFNNYSASEIPDNAFLNVTVNCSCGDSGVSRDYRLFVTYPLRPEDSLSSIASQTNLSSDLLQSYNPDVNFSAGAGLVYIPSTGNRSVPSEVKASQNTGSNGRLVLRTKRPLSYCFFGTHFWNLGGRLVIGTPVFSF